MKMFDRSLIGKKYPQIIFEIKEERLKLFAKATGQSDQLYTNVKFAKEKGHPSLLAPPTFLTVVSMEQEDPYQYLKDLTIQMGKLLHANQEYIYLLPIYAGDILRMESEITDIFDKKEGSLQFVVFTSTYRNQDKVIVGKAKTTLVVR